MSALVLLGNGGLAREIAIIAEVLDPHRERWAALQFVGPEEEAAALSASVDVTAAVGNPVVRLKLWEKYGGHSNLRWPVLVHPRADLGPRVELGHGVAIASGAILTTNIVIAEAAFINIGVTVGHDTHIGRGCVVNPNASISGGVTIGDSCLLGTHAVILEGLSIGAGAIVGAGAVVTRDVEAGAVVVGSPARPIKSTAP
jgi:sugar O-acyltransferase (sialic acid O-acetyltransferase NeuD family)